MEVIYLNHNLIEQGIIQDFELDIAYGKDENDFEIKTPEQELELGWYWYIKDTEYGGIVDEVEAKSNDQEAIYRGRSWQGILNSYSGIQLAESLSPLIQQQGDEENNYVQITGTPKAILTQILVTDLGLGFEIMEDSYEEGEISGKVLATQSLYDMLLELFEPNNLKLNLDYSSDDGLRAGVFSANDFSSDQYFDTSKYTSSAKVSRKVPNHLIGVNTKAHDGNGTKTVIKHIYFDGNGVMQPYYVIDTQNYLHKDKPLDDFEYERAPQDKIVTGLDEIVEVIEGGDTVETYDLVRELQGVTDENPQGTSGNTKFERGVPFDWEQRCYDKYYKLVVDYETDPPKKEYKNFEIEYEYEPFDARSLTDAEWERTFTNYFKRSAEPDPETGKYTFTQLTAADQTKGPSSYQRLEMIPKDWKDKYSSYFYRYYEDGRNKYSSVPAYSYQVPIVQNGKPSNWDTNKGDYYVYWWDNKYYWKVEYQIKSRGKWVLAPSAQPDINFKSEYISKINSNGTKFKVLDDLEECKFKQKYYKYVKQENGTHKRQLINKSTNLGKEIGTQNFSKAQKIKVTETSRFLVHKKQRYQHKKMFTSVRDWCSSVGKKLNKLNFENGKYYRMDNRSKYPDFFRPQGYGDGSGFYVEVQGYTMPPPKQIYYNEVDKIKPLFDPIDTYVKVYDNYSNLCETMLKRYEEIKSASTEFIPSIDVDMMDFDVGDILGGTHPITKNTITSKVTKKIAKINSFGIEVSYEIG